MIDLGLNFEDTAKSPEEMAADLSSSLNGSDSPPSEPPRRKRGRPPGSKNKPKDPSNATPDIAIPKAPEIDPALIAPAFLAIGKRLTEKYDVTEYQSGEADALAKAFAPCLRYLLERWLSAPEAAPFAVFLLVVILQVSPRLAESRIKKSIENPDEKALRLAKP